ncbi:MAG: hypothetical protein QNI86_14410 [Halieaceae bacterium]|nr:hypothetical protein [Halieaceae bacterium]
MPTLLEETYLIAQSTSDEEQQVGDTEVESDEPGAGRRQVFPTRQQRGETSEEEDVSYNRWLPLMAETAMQRGVQLPLPYGIGLVFVSNEAEQRLEQLSVALGRDEIPPRDTPLVDLPFVSIENLVSETDSWQVKLDAWVLPFLNVFAIYGQTEGDVDLDVVVDVDEFLGPPICRPARPCGIARASFELDVDVDVYGGGATAVYGAGNWYGSATASYTESEGSKLDPVKLQTTTLSARLGRTWPIGDKFYLNTYAGVNHTKFEEDINSVARLRDAFPDGGTLFVRYEAKTENEHKTQGIVGMNFGLRRGWGFTVEANARPDNYRYIASATWRW